jgi:flagellar FliL protein
MNKKMLAISGFIIAGLCGIIIYLMFNGYGINSNGTNTNSWMNGKDSGKTFSYDPGGAFITNLKDSRKLLRTSIMIEVKDKGQIKYMTESNFKIRDIILGVLCELSEESFNEGNIMDTLKEDIKRALGEGLDIYGIADIYFSEFVYQ